MAHITIPIPICKYFVSPTNHVMKRILKSNVVKDRWRLALLDPTCLIVMGWYAFILWVYGSHFWGWCSGVPDTSRRQRRQLPPCPLVIALVPLKCTVEIYNFLIGCPLPTRKSLGAPCSFKNEAYRPGCCSWGWETFNELLSVWWTGQLRNVRVAEAPGECQGTLCDISSVDHWGSGVETRECTTQLLHVSQAWLPQCPLLIALKSQ